MFVLIAWFGPRLYLQIGPSHGKIGRTDQTRQLRQRIAISLRRCTGAATAIIVVVGRKGSFRISISHRDDASPAGKPPTHFPKPNRRLPDATWKFPEIPQARAAIAPVNASRPG